MHQVTFKVVFGGFYSNQFDMAWWECQVTVFSRTLYAITVPFVAFWLFPASDTTFLISSQLRLLFVVSVNYPVHGHGVAVPRSLVARRRLCRGWSAESRRFRCPCSALPGLAAFAADLSSRSTSLPLASFEQVTPTMRVNNPRDRTRSGSSKRRWCTWQRWGWQPTRSRLFVVKHAVLDENKSCFQRLAFCSVFL